MNQFYIDQDEFYHLLFDKSVSGIGYALDRVIEDILRKVKGQFNLEIPWGNWYSAEQDLEIYYDRSRREGWEIRPAVFDLTNEIVQPGALPIVTTVQLCMLFERNLESVWRNEVHLQVAAFISLQPDQERLTKEPETQVSFVKLNGFLCSEFCNPTTLKVLQTVATGLVSHASEERRSAYADALAKLSQTV